MAEAFDEKTKEQIKLEKTEDFIANAKDKTFGQVETNQARSAFKFSFGGMLRAFIVFFVILALVVGGMYLFDYIRELA